MKLGIRFRNAKDTSQPAMAVCKWTKPPLIEVFNVDTGEVVEGVFSAKVEYDVTGALRAKVGFYPVEQQINQVEQDD